jgi:predicted transcriptional regulator
MSRGRGRPRKEPVAYDPEQVKDFIKRFFEIQREINVLKEDIKQLKEEFKDKIDHKLIGKVIRLVKAKLALSVEEASPNTVEEVEELVTDKINITV